MNIVLIPTTTRRKEEPKKEDKTIKIDASNVGPKFVEMDNIAPGSVFKRHRILKKN